MADVETNLALPRGTVDVVGVDAAAVVWRFIEKSVAELGGQSTTVSGVVIGLPRTLDDRIGVAGRRAQQFGRLLAQFYAGPIVFVDERFSSQAVAGLGRALGKNSKDMRANLDSGAAALILQQHLDALRTA